MHAHTHTYTYTHIHNTHKTHTTHTFRGVDSRDVPSIARYGASEAGAALRHEELGQFYSGSLWHRKDVLPSPGYALVSPGPCVQEWLLHNCHGVPRRQRSSVPARPNLQPRPVMWAPLAGPWQVCLHGAMSLGADVLLNLLEAWMADGVTTLGDHLPDILPRIAQLKCPCPANCEPCVLSSVEPWPTHVDASLMDCGDGILVACRMQCMCKANRCFSL